MVLFPKTYGKEGQLSFCGYQFFRSDRRTLVPVSMLTLIWSESPKSRHTCCHERGRLVSLLTRIRKMNGQKRNLIPSGSPQSVVEAGSWGLDSACKKHPGTRLWLRWWARCLSIPPSLLYPVSIFRNLGHFHWKPPKCSCFPSDFKSTLSILLLPARPNCLSLPKNLYQLKIKYQAFEPMGGIFT